MEFRFRFGRGVSSSGSPRPRRRGAEVLSRIGLGVFALFWCGIVLTFVSVLLYGIISELVTYARYEPVAGRVVEFTPHEWDEGLEKGSPPHAVITYEVGGVAHRYQALGQETTLRGWSQADGAMVEVTKVGQAVTLYYDPTDPADATLDPRPGDTPPGALLFLTPFVIMGVFVLRALFAPLDVQVATGNTLHAKRFVGPNFVKWAIGLGVLGIAGAILSFVTMGLMNWQGRYLFVVAWVVGGLVVLRAVFRVLAARKRAHEAQAAREDGLDEPEAVRDALALGGDDEQALRRTGREQSRSKRGQVDAGGVAKGMLIFALFWWAIVGVFLGVIVHDFYNQHRAMRTFHETEGKVLGSKVESHSDDDGTTYSPWVKYRYSVNGRVYTAKRVQYGSAGSSDASEARAVVKQFPRGRKVPVYYDPKNPEDAVLLVDGYSSSSFMLLLFIQPFLGAGILVAGVVVVGWRRRARARRQVRDGLVPPAEIAGWGPAWPGPEGLTIRTPRVSIVKVGKAALLAYTVGTFIAIFVVMFLFGPDAEGLGLIVRRALLAAGGLGVGVGLARLLFGRAKVLSIDARSRRITWNDGKSERAFSLDELAGWEATMVRTNITNNNRTVYCPAVRFVPADGEPIEVNRFPTLSIEYARFVAAWLAERSGLAVAADEGEDPDAHEPAEPS